MHRLNSSRLRALLLLAASLLVVACLITKADAQAQSTERAEEVVRVETELVQADVSVFDRQGRFVEDLRREQFELLVDGKAVPISFFERVSAGSFDEEAQLAAARGGARAAKTNAASGAIRPLDRGRTVVFFIDDLHLSLDSLDRTRKSILNFIDREMGQNDRVAIASTTGQLGFLQQFTDNRQVLRAAVARLRTQPNLARDQTSPPMPEYVALSIERKEERGALSFYVEECLKAAPFRYPRRSCEIEVINRARKVLLEASSATSNTYASFESLIDSASQLPGRKLVFFISDGFLLHTGARNADPAGRLRRITDRALRAGVVVYTVYARGLTALMADAAGSLPFDANGRLEQSLLAEIPASQDAMHALAADTGGEALRNTNNFDAWVGRAVKETARYYLLAWRPETEEQKQGKFRQVEVSIKGRPELTVRTSRAYAPESPDPLAASQKEPTEKTRQNEKTEQAERQPAPKTPEGDLRDALSAVHAQAALPVLINLSYLDTPEHGAVLTTSMQVSSAGLAFEKTEGRQRASVDVAGVVLSDTGKTVASFRTRLNVDDLSSTSTGRTSSDVIYNHRAPLAPGLYQVRVAARDRKSGRTGSARDWLEIPNLSTRQLTLSSLLIGVRNVEIEGRTPTGSVSARTTQVQFSVDRRFARSSRLRFLTFVYNAAPASPARAASAAATTTLQPDLAIQAQIFRDDQPVLTTPLQKLKTEPGSDLARIPYEAELSLGTLPAGRYQLRVTVIDRATRRSAAQSADFQID